MKKIRIPFTDLVVSAICLGTGDMGSSLSQEDSFRLLDAFAARGGNFLDSALIYADWLPVERSASEKTIGRWLKQRGNRDRIVVGTKGAHPDLAAMHIPRLSPGEIQSDLERSLRNLQTEPIDLYWLHRDDPGRPAGEIVETLNAAARAGKIRAFGCSNWRAERIAEAQAYAAQHGLAPFAGDQMLWSLAVPDFQALGDPTLACMDGALWELHQQSGLAAIPYSSQANGLFAKLERGGWERLPERLQRVYGSAENVPGRFERARRLAQAHGLTVNQAALAYLLSQPFPTIPIMSTKRLDQLEDSLGAAEVRFSEAEVRFLETGNL
jgi:aryl-alcohol dehydrogenase-like predicted oxidoreductase